MVWIKKFYHQNYILACDNIAKKLGGCKIITNCDKSLLQITTAKLLHITIKCYYKLQQLIYYKLRQFYYKLRQLLQIATIITNYDGTQATQEVKKKFSQKKKKKKKF